LREVLFCSQPPFIPDLANSSQSGVHEIHPRDDAPRLLRCGCATNDGGVTSSTDRTGASQTSETRAQIHHVPWYGTTGQRDSAFPFDPSSWNPPKRNSVGNAQENDRSLLAEGANSGNNFISCPQGPAIHLSVFQTGAF
jgi:hypothetical protein